MSGKTETFGSPASGYAVDQLKARGELVESNAKTVETLKAINSNAGNICNIFIKKFVLLTLIILDKFL